MRKPVRGRKIGIRKNRGRRGRPVLLLLLSALCAGLILLSQGVGFLLELAGFREGLAPALVISAPKQTSPPSEGTDEPAEAAWNLVQGEYDDPVDFLEEILPTATPDPERVSYEVMEIDASERPGSAGISVRDTSDSGLDLKEELAKEFRLEVTEEEPLVLIYHTHSCESYRSSFTGFYYADETSRNTESSRNVAVVGEAMRKSLEAAGIRTIHDTTLHDSPAFNGAYGRSAETAQSYLEKYPSIQITIDVHRDAMIAENGLSYKPTAEVEGRKAAQMMIIAGCDPTGELEYENWRPNLLFALKLQQKGEELYPKLMRPLMFCQRSYNMWLTDSSFLVEVGTQSNTFAEAEYSGRLMGNILAEVIREARG